MAYNRAYNDYEVALLAHVTCLDRADRRDDFRAREILYIDILRTNFEQEKEAELLEKNLEERFPDIDEEEECGDVPVPPPVPDRLNGGINDKPVVTGSTNDN